MTDLTRRLAAIERRLGRRSPRYVVAETESAALARLAAHPRRVRRAILVITGVPEAEENSWMPRPSLGMTNERNGDA